MKKKILTALQVLVTVGILFWLFHDKQKQTQIRDAFAGLKTTTQWTWIVAGIVCYGVVEILALFRWQVLLKVQDVNLSLSRLASLLMIGIFFNQFMPGGTGGDVIKIFYLLRETPGKRDKALLAALIDRMMGLLGLILVAGVLMALRWDWLTQGQGLPHFEFAWLFSVAKMKDWVALIPGATKLIYTLLGLLAASVLGVATSFLITGMGWISKLPAKLPGRDVLIDLSDAYNLYARAWTASVWAIVLSLGIHIASFGMAYCAARALVGALNFLNFVSLMPVVNTLSALPISVGGTGPREFILQTMLPPLCGLNSGQAVAIGLTGWALVLFWGLVGGIVYLFYRPTEHATIAEAQRSVHELQHQIAEAKETHEQKAGH